jgi:L-histidine N-alpha-methyltransferase
MTADPRVEIDLHLDESSALASMPDEVTRGLCGSPKQLPSKYFYDERGSRLFDRITRLPEYYPTRTEQALLREVASRIARLTRPRELLELGSGTADKTRLLIEAALETGELRRFLPFEFSRQVAEESTRTIARNYPELRVHAVVGDFEHHLDRVPRGNRRLVAFLGSTIGNFNESEAIPFLANVARLIDDEGWFLLGTDLVKDTSVLELAYNDSAGVTAAFNRNILDVINEHLQGNLDTESFDHVAFFNREQARIEMHLESRIEQTARLEALDLDLHFDKGERILTEVSCKYTRSSVERILTAAGFQLEHWFTDENEFFALSLARPSKTARPRGE